MNLLAPAPSTDVGVSQLSKATALFDSASLVRYPCLMPIFSCCKDMEDDTPIADDSRNRIAVEYLILLNRLITRVPIFNGVIIFQ